MPFKVRPIHHGRILLVRATGAADAADWTRLIASPALQIARFGVIIDLRRRHPLPTSEVALSIGRDLTRLAKAVPAVAIVAREGVQFGLTRMVDNMAESGGLSTRSFLTLRDAYVWVCEQM